MKWLVANISTFFRKMSVWLFATMGWNLWINRTVTSLLLWWLMTIAPFRSFVAILASSTQTHTYSTHVYVWLFNDNFIAKTWIFLPFSSCASRVCVTIYSNRQQEQFVWNADFHRSMVVHTTDMWLHVADDEPNMSSFGCDQLLNDFN